MITGVINFWGMGKCDCLKLLLDQMVLESWTPLTGQSYLPEMATMVT